MLKWQKAYYIGESVKNPVKIQTKINKGRPVPGIYLVTLSDNPGNLMEIIPAVMLVQKTAYDLCPTVIGMAKGKEEALELVQKMIEDVYGETGGFEIEKYMKNR
jgi:hypothetical protein